MASILNADTSNGLKITSDTSGELKIQSAGADIVTIDSSGITMAAGKTVSNSGIATGQVLEYITGICDGNSVITPYGSYTLTDVTARQTLTASYAVVDGSSITYTPPANTKKVVYRFSFIAGYNNGFSIGHFNFYIDSDEVTRARFSNSAQYNQNIVNFEWVMDIGNSTDTTTGRLTSWTTNKTLQMRARYYSASVDGFLHETTAWDGVAPSAVLHKPRLTIIAIG
jgi:hypothetical protein